MTSEASDRFPRGTEPFAARRRFVYVLSLLVMLALSCNFLAHGPRFESNILSLLPEIYRDPVVEAAVRKQALSVASKVIVIVRSPQLREAEATAVAVAARLRESGRFARVEERASSELFTATKELFLRHPFQLSSPPVRLDDLLEETRQQAFSPEGVIWLQNVDRDPLLLFPNYLQTVLSIGARFSLQNGFVHISEPDSESVLIFATLAGEGAFSPNDDSISQLFRSLPHFASATVHPAGLVFFAEESAARTKREVSTITFVTLGLLIALLLAVFRSLRPVVLTAVCIVTSFMIAIFLGDILWRSLTDSSLHLITIGFGSSLLGVSIDYALHYVVAQRTWPATSSESPLARIRSGLKLGYFTTAIAFLGIALSPFPGLRQLALFCVLGLSLALLFVVVLLPLLSGKPVYDSHLVKLSERAQLLRSRAVLVGMLCLVAILCIVGLPRLRVVDDIRALNNPSQALVKNQREAARLVGFSDGGTLLVIQGDSEQHVLEREESLLPLLTELIDRGELGGYRALSRVVPSQQLQNQRLKAFSELLRSNPELVRATSEELHLPPKARETMTALSSATAPPPLTISECISSSACDSVRDLWVGLSNGKVVSIVALSGLTSRTYTELFNREGVTAINQADAISNALKLYRSTAIRYTAYFYLVVFALLLVRYGLSGALRVFLPSIIGSLAALATLGVAGIPINAFSVFAMIVLLGVSIDYSIFFAEDTEQHAATGLAVLLSALTTALSFGLLSFSSTPALQGFGIVLSVGCVVAAIAAQALPGFSNRARSSCRAPLEVILLALVSGCSLHIPPPTIRSGKIPPDVETRALCAHQGIQVEMGDGYSAESSASLECTDTQLTIVFFNAFGMRVRTITIGLDGSFRDELAYVAGAAEPAEAVVRRVQDLLHTRSHKS